MAMAYYSMPILFGPGQTGEFLIRPDRVESTDAEVAAMVRGEVGPDRHAEVQRSMQREFCVFQRQPVASDFRQ